MSSHDQLTMFRRSDPGHKYLESTVHSATPARLRLMLIERAIDVAGNLSANWRQGKALGENEWSLWLLDLLTELLNGVASSRVESERQVCQTVSDLYVFLIQHLIAAEAASRADAIDEIRLVLNIEAQTWALVCANERSPLSSKAPAANSATSTAFNIQV